VNDTVQVAAVAFSTLLLGLVLELVRRRRLTEEHSLIWVIGALALLALSSWRNVLDVLAPAIGVHYPPALLLLALTGFVLLVSLYFSVVISRQRRDIERLLEEIALLGTDVRQLRGSGRPVSRGEMMPYASKEGSEPAQAGSLAGQQHMTGIQPDDQPVA
jgi:hypothetical protein